MLRTKAPPITRYDYQQMPAGPPHYQLIGGDLIMSPSANLFHQSVAGRIYYTMAQFLETHPVGFVFIAPLDVFLTEVNVYQPDVVFVSLRQRSIITPDGIEGAPDLVVEVLLPGTAGLDRGSKRKIYARTGVKELWLVDPELKLIAVYQLARDPEAPAATHDAKSMFQSPLLPGLRFKASSLFKSALEE